MNRDVIIANLSNALRALLNRDQKNTCQHEETHRAGFLWTICDQCGAKWADDNGGKPDWKEPPEWEQAENALLAASDWKLFEQYKEAKSTAKVWKLNDERIKGLNK